MAAARARKRKWDDVRLPPKLDAAGEPVVDGYDADGFFFFQHTMELADVGEVTVKLVTRKADGALGFAEPGCVEDDAFNWFGEHKGHRSAHVALKHANAYHGRPKAKKEEEKKKMAELLKGQRHLFSKRPAPAPAPAPTRDVAAPADTTDDLVAPMEDDDLSDAPSVPNDARACACARARADACPPPARRARAPPPRRRRRGAGRARRGARGVYPRRTYVVFLVRHPAGWLGWLTCGGRLPLWPALAVATARAARRWRRVACSRHSFHGCGPWSTCC